MSEKQYDDEADIKCTLGMGSWLRSESSTLADSRRERERAHCDERPKETTIRYPWMWCIVLSVMDSSATATDLRSDDRERERE